MYAIRSWAGWNSAGQGLFRPEVTTPLGVSVPVIAWGLRLDRMAMVALGIHDIRDLFSADLEFIRTMRGSFRTTTSCPLFPYSETIWKP